MKEMIKRVREEKGGFTLAELLIVVAIILVLVAIAVPVFTGAMGDANKAVENSSISSVKHTAASDIVLNSKDYLDTNGDLTGPWTVNAETDGQGNITKLEVSDGWAADAVEKATKKDAGGYTIVAKVETTDVTKK